MGIVVRRYIYRFPHITYPYSTSVSSFCSSIPNSLFILKINVLSFCIANLYHTYLLHYIKTTLQKNQRDSVSNFIFCLCGIYCADMIIIMIIIEKVLYKIWKHICYYTNICWQVHKYTLSTLTRRKEQLSYCKHQQQHTHNPKTCETAEKRGK